jgi:diaminopimelate decarboxylase
MASVDDAAVLRTEIAGVPVQQIVGQCGTPTYVYDESTILQRIEELRSFDVIRYAQKACSTLAILDVMRRQNVVVDAVSAGEIHRALKAGYAPTGDPPPIVYTADIFDQESLDLVVDLGLHANLGSPDMIAQLGEVAPGRNVTLRVNPGFGHGHSQKTNTGGEQSKHGIWHEQIEPCAQSCDRMGLAITGLHMHIGSGTDLEHLAQVCDAMEQAARLVGRSITSISAGGGLPIPYLPQDQRLDLPRYFELWDATRKRLESDFGHAISLEIEPGRYLMAESGYLIAEIRAVKRMGANTFYLLDAGFNNLARPILYGAHHPMSLVPRDGNMQRPSQEVIVGGPLCESGDIFTQQEGGVVCQRTLPQASVGDYLVMECAGAYGFVMSSNYNSKPLAAEALIRDGRAHLIRARQTPEDLMRGEVIPS